MIPLSEHRAKASAYERSEKYLRDNCEQTIRRLITATLKARPEDVLDYMAKWISKERGVPLAEVEAEVIKTIRERGIREDTRKYRIIRDESIDILNDKEDNLPKDGNQLPDNVLPGSIQVLEEEGELEIVYSDDEEAQIDHLPLEDRVRRRVNNSITFKTLDEETKEVVIKAMGELIVK